jgi:hypothetical protein
MLSILAFATAAASPTVAKPSFRAMPVCQKTGPTTVEDNKSVHAQKLNELPNANHYLTILRTEDGCSKPAIVRYDIGGAPKRH